MEEEVMEAMASSKSGKMWKRGGDVYATVCEWGQWKGNGAVVANYQALLTYISIHSLLVAGLTLAPSP